MKKHIKVLIVDDSAVVRTALSEGLSADKDIEVVGVAMDPFIARDKILALKPDVLTLDIEMPRLDGLSFLKRLMDYYPLPVIMVSSVTTHDPFAAVKALENGAFDIVNKPGGSISVQNVIEEVIFKVKNAYAAREQFLSKFRQSVKKPENFKTRPVHKKQMLVNVKTTDKLIAMGASTGGTVALEQIISLLPPGIPPIVVVQHMPQGFTRQFADRLNELSEARVKEAEEGELIVNGTVYIAPGGIHMALERKGANLFVKLVDSERVHFQKPAVDILFESVAAQAGKNALGVLLTGMGKDGAAGLMRMKEEGARTIAQDEASSVVWGMPRAAVEAGAAERVLDLKEIPPALIQYSNT